MSWALIPLTEQQREIQTMAAEFAAAEIAPCAAKWDREAHFERSRWSTRWGSSASSA